jgi:RES domain-containing protein
VTLRSLACEPAGHLWVRVVKPDWQDPFDASFAGAHGGRWNPPGSWPTLYLNRDLDTARAQVARLLEGTFAAPDDLSDDAFVLVAARVQPVMLADVVSVAGVKAAGLPATYPVNANGSVVSHGRCQAVGVQARDAGLGGVEARSACMRDGSGRELALWSSLAAVSPVKRRSPYGRWRGRDVVDPGVLFG